ncbi:MULTISPECIES: EAL domain-containing protein [unclassified Photobacterium]|uniref:EAL domain-containing protein n=1 Tax=unclassified Photobacterium TaxID=2628852 RepID=UPI001EDDF743|nr:MULTISPECIES: EAL domain-containing protein [unclassified Photobacterium]MCG3863791.1 EAL domain-containing protein [Photobacterium sp. Ph6]MCG3875321.1 EAL domain-containing protein [Photobacterium sp. Ph5]
MASFLVFMIFFVGLVVYHKDITIESESSLQRSKFDKLFVIEKDLKHKFQQLTIPTVNDEKELIKLVSCKCHISSVAVIYKGKYVYSTFMGLVSMTGNNIDSGFALRAKNSINDIPSIQYVFPVNENTKIKLYLKPFEFSHAKEMGIPKINFRLSDIDLYEGNEPLNELTSDIFNFDLSDLELLVEIDYPLLFSSMIKHHRIKMVLMLFILLGVSFQLQKIIECRLLLYVLNKQWIIPYIQPIVNRNGEHIGGEVLARWVDEKGKVVSPAYFIPTFENYNIIMLLTRSLLEQVSHYVRGMNVAPLRLSFNLTEECLFDHEVFKLCAKLSQKCNLVLEFTETSLFSDPKVNEVMGKYRKFGIKFAIDDYGTGNSSLSYLLDYQFDYVKIDKHFIDNICTDQRSRHVVECVCAMAERFNLDLIPEGVENESQRASLEQYSRVTYYQGYLFSKPLCLSDFFHSTWN